MLTGASRIKTKFRQSNYDMYNSSLVTKDIGDLIKTQQMIMDKMKNQNDEPHNIAATFSNYSIK